MIKLNLGCGPIKMEGYINIDAAEQNDPDMLIVIGKESLLEKFEADSVDEVIASNIVEHLFHWEAVKLLNDLYSLMKKDAVLVLGLPDFDAVVERKDLSSEQKITRIFGGQDIPQGEKDITIRSNHPELFCHKFVYTKASISKELSAVGFTVTLIEDKGTNMFVKAKK